MSASPTNSPEYRLKEKKLLTERAMPQGVKTMKIRHMAGSLLGLLIASSIALAGTQAKHQSKPVVKPGVVSGRVFLITVSGDLKPARMAKVYLLYMYRTGDSFYEHKDIDSAGIVFFYAENKAIDDSRKDAEAKAAGDVMAEAAVLLDKAADCLRKLAATSTAIDQTLDWVTTNKKQWQVVIGQADEEGNFKISVPHPGEYRLVIYGHAGFNDAVWETYDFTVRPGSETTMKMGSPGVACVQTGN